METTYKRILNFLGYVALFFMVAILLIGVGCLWVVWGVGKWIGKRFRIWAGDDFCPKCGEHAFLWETSSFYVNEMQGTRRWRGECYICGHVETRVRSDP